jgi:hypothetical protein
MYDNVCNIIYAQLFVYCTYVTCMQVFALQMSLRMQSIVAIGLRRSSRVFGLPWQFVVPASWAPKLGKSSAHLAPAAKAALQSTESTKSLHWSRAFPWFPWPLLIADVKCQEEQEQKSFAAIRIPIEFLYWKCSTSKHDCWICFVNLAMIASLTSDGSTDPKHLHACFPKTAWMGLTRRRWKPFWFHLHDPSLPQPSVVEFICLCVV